MGLVAALIYWVIVVLWVTILANVIASSAQVERFVLQFARDSSDPYRRKIDRFGRRRA
jgi:hypothetical protein